MEHRDSAKLGMKAVRMRDLDDSCPAGVVVVDRVGMIDSGIGDGIDAGLVVGECHIDLDPNSRLVQEGGNGVFCGQYVVLPDRSKAIDAELDGEKHFVPRSFVESSKEGRRTDVAGPAGAHGLGRTFVEAARGNQRDR